MATSTNWSPSAVNTRKATGSSLCVVREGRRPADRATGQRLFAAIGRGADCPLESGAGVTLSREMQTALHRPDCAVFALFGSGA